MTDQPRDAADLLADFVSRERSRIYSATWAIIASRDPAVDQYEPEKEQLRGHVRIVSTTEPGW